MDEKLLFDNNYGKSVIKYTVKKYRIFVKINRDRIGLEFILELILLINEIENRYENVKIPITLHFEEVRLIDKLTITLLEAICNYVICNCKRDIKIEWFVNNTISSAGIDSSLLLLLATGKRKHIDIFIEKYSFDQFGHHYRRVISSKEKKDSVILSKVFSEINTFFKVFKVSDQAGLEVAEFLIELVGNVKEHTDSDCIIDLDVTDASYIKKGTRGGKNNLYYGINIAVLNFSDQLLGDGIKELLLTNDNLEGRYMDVKNAYDYHKEFFSENYDEDDFFNITTFQHKISGREDIVSTGGTGLTKFISSLEKKADAHHCYVVSGNRGICFKQEYLEYNENMWIGFNKTNDYLKSIPDESLLITSKLYIPGTAYNLNFVMKKEE